MKFAALTAVAASPAMAWPGMRRQTAAAEDYIGPPCTVGKCPPLSLSNGSNAPSNI